MYLFIYFIKSNSGEKEKVVKSRKICMKLSGSACSKHQFISYKYWEIKAVFTFFTQYSNIKLSSKWAVSEKK